MKYFKLVVIVLAAAASAGGAFASRCTHDSDRAADGSRCGGRSSDSRPGGK